MLSVPLGLLGLVPAPLGLVGDGLEGPSGDLGLEAVGGCVFLSKLRIPSVNGRAAEAPQTTRVAPSSPSPTAAHPCSSAAR